MEIFGINSHIRDVVERVAGEGYVALAPDFFHRTGPGVEYGYDDEGMQKGMALLGQLEGRRDDRRRARRDRLSARRTDVTGDRIGAMGFCIGGHMTYLTACETDVGAAASFYGGGIAAPQGLGGAESTVSRTPGIARADPVPVRRGRRHDPAGPGRGDPQGAQQARAPTTRSWCIPGADHGFFCDQRATYHKDAAKDAWERVKKLFKAELRG